MSTPATPPQDPVLAPAGTTRLRRVRVAAILGLVVALGIFALPHAVNVALGQERLKGFAELFLSQALGRKVTVEGAVRLSSLPWMSLRAESLLVDDAPGFGPQPFLTVRLVTVDIRILPLFTRTIMPGAITLTSPVLMLKRDAGDRSNWEGLPLFDLPAPADRPSPLLTAPENGGAHRSEAPPGWEVAPVPSGIRIQDATVAFEDRRRGFSWTLTHLTLATGRGERFDFHLSFDVSGLTPAVQAQIHAKGTAGFDPDRVSLSVDGALVEATLSVPGDERFTPAHGGEPWRMALRATVDCDTASGALAVRDLSATSADAHLEGGAEITGLLADLRATATITLHADAAGALGLATGLSALAGRVDAPEPAPPAPREGRRSFLDFSSRFLSGQKERPPGDISLEARLSAAPDKISLDALTLRLRQAEISGRADYLPGERPRLTAALAADNLDLDRLPWGAGSQAWVLPTAFLQDALGRVSLDARSLTVAGVTFSRVTLTGASERGQFRVYPVSAATPSGLLTADVRGEVRGQALDITAEADIAAPPAPGGRARRPATLLLRGTADTAGVTGNLSLAAADPLSPARFLGLASRDAGSEQALPELSLKAVFAMIPGRDRPFERIEIKDMDAHVGPDAITGGVVVHPGPEAALEVALNLDTLDQDRLAALFAPAAAPPDPGYAAPPAPASPDAVTGLPAITGRIAVGKAALLGLEAKNLTVEGGFRRGVADIGALGGELFGGKLSGKAEASLRPGANRLSANVALAGADAAALTNKALTGPCTLRLAAEGSGDSPQTMLAAVSGRLEAELSRDPRPGRKGEEPAFTRIKAGIDFKGRAGKPDNGGGDAARSYDLTASLAAQGPSSLREIKADATAVAAVAQDGVQIGQGKLTGTAGIFLPGEQGGRVLPVTFGSGFSLDSARGAFAARNLTIEAAGSKGSGKIEKKGRDEGGKLSGAFDFPDMNPRDVLPALGFPAPPQAATDDLRHGALSFQLAEAGNGYEFKGLSLTLDDMRATGSVHFRSGFSRPKIDLDISHLDMDRYYPQPPPDPKKPKDAGQDDPIDLAALRACDVEARVRFGWLKKGNIVWKNGQTDFSARGGLYSVRHEAGDFYGGRFSAEARGDARDVVLKASLDLTIDGFDAATLLKEWAEGDVLASGGTTFVLSFKSNGLTERALRRNISGSSRFQVTRGALRIRESGSSPPPATAQAAEPHGVQTSPAQSTHKPPAEPKYDLLPFSVLSSSYTVREGMAITNDFLIESKDMRVNGTGYVDLRDESIDLTVAATLESGAKIPATIRGPLEDPKLEIDRSKLFGDMVYRILKGIITMPGKALGRIFNVN